MEADANPNPVIEALSFEAPSLTIREVRAFASASPNTAEEAIRAAHDRDVDTLRNLGTADWRADVLVAAVLRDAADRAWLALIRDPIELHESPSLLLPPLPIDEVIWIAALSAQDPTLTWMNVSGASGSCDTFINRSS